MSGVTVYNSQYPDGHEVGSLDFRDVAHWIEHHGWTDFLLETRDELKQGLASCRNVLLYMRSEVIEESVKRIEEALTTLERMLPVEERE
jgi:hypothetical protein